MLQPECSLAGAYYKLHMQVISSKSAQHQELHASYDHMSLLQDYA